MGTNKAVLTLKKKIIKKKNYKKTRYSFKLYFFKLYFCYHPIFFCIIKEEIQFIVTQIIKYTNLQW